jgi:hypothetical protein
MPRLIEAPINMGHYEAQDRDSFLNYAVEYVNATHDQGKIVLIDIDDLYKHLKNIDIDESLKFSRYQLIVRNEHHYTAVDIDKSIVPPSCIILDATNDPRMFHIYCSAKDSQFDAFCFMGYSMAPTKNLQTDAHSCSMFAFDHCVQLSCTHSNPDFHKMLAAKANEQDTLFWDELPPNFLWNTQSLTTLNEYAGLVVKKDPGSLDETMPNGLSFNEYIHQGICSYEEDGQEVRRNESINVHVFAALVQRWSDEESAEQVEESSTGEFKKKYKGLMTETKSSEQQPDEAVYRAQLP